ncbi:wax ester/triacylglycerol synthase domain-containing protein [Actinoplanes sp. NPDC048967]|uniref:wax ester/triacylglycerol synthase domain-containing protein n=1 Tax=Actinoplanes sp. NPDC048967 TaxID=3155269 RepID=UPI0033CFFAD2
MSTRRAPAQPAGDPGRAGAGNAGDRMSELETLMWRGEQHPRRSSTTAVLMMLDAVPGWDRLSATHERLTRLVPRTRMRVLEPAVPVGPPAWVPDPTFALDYHLRRVSLPAPGGMAELLRFAQSAAMAPFDRTRPLWEATLIEGLPGGRAAYLLKLHRSITDGSGGLSLMSRVQRRRAGDSRPSAWWLAADEFTDQLLAVPCAAGKMMTAGAQALSHPAAAAASAVRFAGSLRRIAAPSLLPGSPLLRGRTGTSWRFRVMDCPRADLEAAAETAGGSADDASIAALLGGMRRYHERHGIELAEMTMTMPVSRRKPDVRTAGHEGSGVTFRAPAGTADPAERIAAIRGITLSLRAEPALNARSALVPLLNRVPAAVRAATGRLSIPADMSAAPFPGLPSGIHLAGTTVERIYPFEPLPGTAVMAAMVPYLGTCHVGMTIDGSVVPDPEVLVECMREGLDEVLRLARSGSTSDARPLVGEEQT